MVFFNILFGLSVIPDDFRVGIVLGVVDFQFIFSQIVKGVDTAEGVTDRNLGPITHAVEANSIAFILVKGHLSFVSAIVKLFLHLILDVLL